MTIGHGRCETERIRAVEYALGKVVADILQGESNLQGLGMDLKDAIVC
jgi:hypothetical protein